MAWSGPQQLAPGMEYKRLGKTGLKASRIPVHERSCPGGGAGGGARRRTSPPRGQAAHKHMTCGGTTASEHPLLLLLPVVACRPQVSVLSYGSWATFGNQLQLGQVRLVPLLQGGQAPGHAGHLCDATQRHGWWPGACVCPCTAARAHGSGRCALPPGSPARHCMHACVGVGGGCHGAWGHDVGLSHACPMSVWAPSVWGGTPR